MQVADGAQAMLVRMFNTDDVVSCFLEPVRCDGISVGSVLDRVSVGLDRDPRAAISEIPGFLGSARAESTDLEGDGRTNANTGRGEIVGMDGGRQLFRVRLIDHLDNGEIIIHATIPVSNLEDLTVRPGLLVTARDLGSGGSSTIMELPFVAGDGARFAPRLASIQYHGFVGPG